MTGRSRQTRGPEGLLCSAAVLLAAAIAGTALAQQPRSPSISSPPAAPAPLARPVGPSTSTSQCAAAYHQALDPVRRDRATGLGELMRKSRAPDADLPGGWLYSAQLFQKAKPKQQAKVERICVETKEVRGQQRCVKFDVKPQPRPAPELTTKAQPQAEDLRYLRLVAEIVDSKGAVPEVSANGRQTFLVQRLAQDLRLYVSQPSTPVLCAGATDLLEFYSGQVAPVKRRSEELKTAAKRIAELAASRTRDVAVVEGRLYDQAMAIVKTAEEARAKAVQARAAAEAAQATAATTAQPGAGPVPPSTPPAALPAPPIVPPLPAKPAAPASLADYAVTSATAQIREALRPLLPADLVTEIGGERDVLTMLTRAHKALLDPDLKLTNPPAQEIRDTAIAALRLHEARIYAERYAARYGEIETLLTGTLADVKAAHGTFCTCRD